MARETWYRKKRVGPVVVAIGKGERRVYFASWGMWIIGRYALSISRPLPSPSGTGEEGYVAEHGDHVADRPGAILTVAVSDLPAIEAAAVERVREALKRREVVREASKALAQDVSAWPRRLPRIEDDAAACIDAAFDALTQLDQKGDGDRG